MSDYQIANDGTIFRIKEDGSISKLGKIENDNITTTSRSTTASNSESENKPLIAALILFTIITLVLGILLFQARNDYDNAINDYSSKISSLEEKISTMDNDLITAKNERDASKRELSIFKGYIGNTVPFIISDIEIANTDSGSAIETAFGGRLYSSRSMYLTPRIKYNGIASGSKTIYVRLYTPNGVLSTGNSSPRGYTYSHTINVYSGENAIQLNGWGNSTKGHWAPGVYRIEIWYNNTCLKSKTFTIY